MATKTKKTNKQTKKKSNGTIFTANTAGMPLHQDFLKALLWRCKYGNYELKVIETPPVIKDEKAQWDGVPMESRVSYDTREIKLNNNFRMLNLGVSPLSSNPTGDIAGNTRETILVASPKQTSETIPNMETLPRLLLSTGSINRPVYPYGKKSTEKARMNHLIGAYIIEVKDSETFFPFNIQAFSDGSFADRGVRYFPNGKKVKIQKSEIVRVDGDDHAAESDTEVCALLDKIQQHEVQAWCKISHDTWSQAVSNHHSLGEKITNAKSVASGLYKVEQEIGITHDFLSARSKIFDQVVVIPANHNEALDRMLEDGRYLEESVNWLSGHVLSLAKYYDVDPVKFATGHYPNFMEVIEKFMQAVKDDKAVDFKLSSKTSLDNVKFLKKGQSFRFGGFELARHGDEGGNGSKGSPKAMRRIHGNCVTGHTHSPCLYNKAGVVGTGTGTPEKDHSPGYAKNKPSSWMNAVIFVYAPADLKGEGTIQLCNIINNEWTTQKFSTAK